MKAILTTLIVIGTTWYFTPTYAQTKSFEEQLINDLWDHYGQKNSSVHPDLESIKAIPLERWINIVHSWYGLDNAPFNYEPHWHANDRHDQNFENFTSKVFFVSFDKQFSTPKIKCNKYPHRSEILLINNDKKWLDINIGGFSDYSITLWDWYNTVAIKSGDITFLHHGKPTMYRWNEEVPKSLIVAIANTQQFEIYLEPNPLRIGGMLMTREDKRNYKIPPKLNLKGTVTLNDQSKITECLAR